jgi:DNA (cytosine-5)-methyltransferase 1
VTSKTANRSATLDRKTPLKALSFFSGCMGLDLGLEQEGIEILLACESDPQARSTIEFNRPDIALIENIRDYSAAEIREKAGLSSSEEIDLMVGSPPCQAFSIVGAKQGFDGQNDLFLTFIDLIAELQPKFAVIETVPGLLNLSSSHSSDSTKKVNHPTLVQDKQIGDVFSSIIHRLEKAGYGVSFNLYNTADFGSPQERKRVFIICSRDGKELPSLTPTHANNGLDGLPEWQTLRDAIEEISGDEHSFRKLSQAELKYYRLLKPGQNWQNLPADLQQEVLQRVTPENKSRKTGLYRRLAWDKPSPTLLSDRTVRNSLVHPEADRWLSIEEYKRIQEFPDDWKIEGSRIDQYRQLGNATPCSLGRAIAKMLLTYLGQEGSISYTKTIKKIFDSIKTSEEWEREVHSSNPLNKYEKYFQIATCKYFTLNDIENEIEVTCHSGRMDVVVKSMNMIIEFKAIFDNDNLQKGVTQLNKYARSTKMSRKVLIGLSPKAESKKKIGIIEEIQKLESINANLEIHMFDPQTEKFDLYKILRLDRENCSDFYKDFSRTSSRGCLSSLQRGFLIILPRLTIALPKG